MSSACYFQSLVRENRVHDEKVRVARMCYLMSLNCEIVA
jgi:hypothetical protein